MQVSKRALAAIVSKGAGVPAIHCERVIDETIKAVLEVTRERGKVNLGELGYFYTKKIAPRRYKDPRTGAMKMSTVKFKVAFHAGIKADRL